MKKIWLIGLINHQDLDAKARSYLDINCAHCHIEGGSADTSGLYLDYTENRKINLGIFKKPVATGRASNNLSYSIVPGNQKNLSCFLGWSL